MGGIMKRVSPSSPCPICGSPDYDMVIDYGEDGSVIWCHKMTQPGNVIVNGKEFVCIKVGKQIDIGTFNLYKEKDEYERIRERDRQRWIEEQKRLNPDWKPSKNYNAATRNKVISTAAPVSFSSSYEVIEDVKPLSAKALDERYRYFLSLLVLEPKHEKKLLDEWSSAVYPSIARDLLRTYPIRSLPLEDFHRFKSSEKFSNKSRKQIVAAMVKRFGTLEGVPGFYMRSGPNWENKSAEERWTFVNGEGIIFPMYDHNGYLYRIRLRDDYPDKKVKGESLYNGEEGVLRHRYEDGKHVWLWYAKGSKEPVVAKNLIFDDWGVPKLGKPQNKYKAFSSWYDKQDGDKIINAFYKGCKPGSPYSLYIPNNAKYKVVLGTEGEKKSMVATYCKNTPTVCIPGVGSYKTMFEPVENGKSLIDILKERGMKYFILCYDADKSENDMVANAERSCLEALKEAGVIPLIGEWSGKFDKGLDDILLMGIDIKTRLF